MNDKHVQLIEGITEAVDRVRKRVREEMLAQLEGRSTGLEYDDEDDDSYTKDDLYAAYERGVYGYTEWWARRMHGTLKTAKKRAALFLMENPLEVGEENKS